MIKEHRGKEISKLPGVIDRSRGHVIYKRKVGKGGLPGVDGV